MKLSASACLLGLGALAFMVISYGLYQKGDVKAGVKMFGIEFSIETKDATAVQKR